MNPYEILGVERDATSAEIKRAYRDKAKAAHPDQGGDELAFKDLSEAYRILLDPAERAHYDAHGEPIGGSKDRRKHEMMAMLTQVGGKVAGEMENPDTQDFIAAFTADIQGRMYALDDLVAGAAAAMGKMVRVKKRLRSKTGDTLMAELLQSKIDGLSAEIERAKTMKTAYLDGLEFLKDYDYEVTQLLMSSDLTSVYDHINRGGSFYTFGPK